ncbi:hypothetical protein [Stutzerimonas frequens]|uniref:hypothetical protein n=1 Tax=Stutzerimonas frequens TaxID=2968969 RepID=UPI001AAEEDB5|nr:hypothetical protein [Stutzerimonas frequens]QTF58134.1 hypothetical protein J4H94_06265 [Stutzerimonas frequens]
MLYPIELLGPDHAGGILATPGPFVMPHAVRAHTRQIIRTSSENRALHFAWTSTAPRAKRNPDQCNNTPNLLIFNDFLSLNFGMTAAKDKAHST